MILVVIGHFAESNVDKVVAYKWLFLFIYSFHMPLFIFVSGLFHKDNDITRKVVFYLSVYLAEKILTFFVSLYVSGSYSFSLLTESGLAWFVFSIAIYEAVTYLLRDINKKYLIVLFGILGCFLGYDKTVGDYLVLSRTLIFFPFYLLGACTSREMLERAACSRKVKLAGCILLVFAAFIFYVKLDSLYILRHLFTGRNAFKEEILPYGPLCRAGCYVYTAVISLAFILAAPTKRIRLLTGAGSKTLQIYFWHQSIRKILVYFGVSTLVFKLGFVGKIVWLLAGVAVAYLCTLPIFGFPTAVIHKILFQNSGEDTNSKDGGLSILGLSTEGKLMKLLKDLKKKHIFLFEELVKRDFKQKYKRTVLGMCWSVLSPLLTLLVMKVVFTEFFGRNTQYFTTYMFCGNIVYTYYKESTKSGMSALMDNKGIITKINVPKYLFLLSKNVSSLINFGLTLVLLFIFAAIDGVPFGFHFLALIYPIVCLVVFNIGIGLILSALFVFFRDISYLYDVFTLMVMYCSAIFYQVDRYPASVRQVFFLNPVYCYIDYFRVVTMKSQLPDLKLHLLCAVYAVAALVIGGTIYKKQNQKFLYYM